jgi:hypothetical protein
MARLDRAIHAFFFSHSTIKDICEVQKPASVWRKSAAPSAIFNYNPTSPIRIATIPHATPNTNKPIPPPKNVDTFP